VRDPNSDLIFLFESIGDAWGVIPKTGEDAWDTTTTIVRHFIPIGCSAGEKVVAGYEYFLNAVFLSQPFTLPYQIRQKVLCSFTVHARYRRTDRQTDGKVISIAQRTP